MRLPYCILATLVGLGAGTVIRAQGHDSDQNSSQLAVWRIVKDGLQKPGAERFFESNVKDVLLPDGVNGVKFFVGTVLSSKPSDRPHELVLALSDLKTPEVTLRLVDEFGQTALRKPLPPGTRVAFEGVVRTFTKEPFMLTFEVQADLRKEFAILDDSMTKSDK